MLVVEVFLHLATVVDYFLFFLVLVILLIIGILVLLYYNASYYYLYRGGGSAGGVTCGVFFADARYTTSAASWYAGAALSFIYLNKILLVDSIYSFILV